MREIKFRGKSVYNGKWVYGDLINYESGEVSILEQKFSKYGYEATEIINRTKIDPSTVGQYTGLKDKNGVEIYEADLLKTFCGIHVVVSEKYNFIAKGFYDSCQDNPRDLFSEDAEFEVIGNIYDNTELLGGE